eukprot:286643-Rhodomonas_salina.4
MPSTGLGDSVVPAYTRATPSPVLKSRVVLPEHYGVRVAQAGAAMRCPVLTRRMMLPDSAYTDWELLLPALATGDIGGTEPPLPAYAAPYMILYMYTY